MTTDSSDPSTWLRSEGGIPYRVVDRTCEFEKESAVGEEIILVRATDVLTYINDVVFPAPTQTGQSFQYPPTKRFGGLTRLGAQRVSVRGHVDGLPSDFFGDDTGAPDGTYNKLARLTISYTTPEGAGDDNNDTTDSDPNDPSTFLEIRGNSTCDVLNTTAPGAGWVPTKKKYILGKGFIDVDSSEENLVPATIVVPETQWTCRWPRVPYTKFTRLVIRRLRRLMGKVNSKSIPWLFNAEPDTILFLGFDYEQQFTWRTAQKDQPPVSITLKFLEKHIQDGEEVRGHNHIWRPGVGWQIILINDKDEDTVLYDRADLNQMFSTSLGEDDVIPLAPPTAADAGYLD